MALIAQITAQAWRVSTRSAVGWQALRRWDVLGFTWGVRAVGWRAPAQRRGGARPFASSENHVSWSDRHAPHRPSDTQPKEIRDALCRWFRAGRAEGQHRGLQGAGENGLRDLDRARWARLCRMHRRRRALRRADFVSARGDGEGGRDRGVRLDRLSRPGDSRHRQQEGDGGPAAEVGWYAVRRQAHDLRRLHDAAAGERRDGVRALPRPTRRCLSMQRRGKPFYLPVRGQHAILSSPGINNRKRALSRASKKTGWGNPWEV